MRTSLDIPDELFRKTKSLAAQQGISLREYVIASLRERLRTEAPSWRGVFGSVKLSAVKELDQSIDAEFAQVNEDEWR